MIRIIVLLKSYNLEGRKITMTAPNIEIQNYFRAEISKCLVVEKNLRADERNDEAVRMRIQKNVLDILNAVLAASSKCGVTEQEIRNCFLAKAAEIAGHWYDSLHKADALGDFQRIQVERVKIGAYQEAIDAANKIWSSCS